MRKSISVKGVRDNAIYAIGLFGNSITEDIIPEGVKVLKDSEYEKMILQDLNGVDVIIDKSTTVEEAINQWETKRNELSRKRQAEYNAWLKTPEGIKYQKDQEEKAKKHEAFVYHSFEEAMTDISKIEPVDLKSNDVSMEEAVKFCEKVCTSILKCEDLRFTDEQMKQFSDALEAIGCTTYKKASMKFHSNKETGIGIDEPNNIAFPLSAFSQLIGTDRDTFAFGLSKMTDGGLENSWIGIWLKAQEAERENAKKSQGNPPSLGE